MGVKLRPSFTQITSVITHTGTQLELDWKQSVHAVQCVKELVLRYSISEGHGNDLIVDDG